METTRPSLTQRVGIPFRKQMWGFDFFFLELISPSFLGCTSICCVERCKLQRVVFERVLALHPTFRWAYPVLVSLFQELLFLQEW